MLRVLLQETSHQVRGFYVKDHLIKRGSGNKPTRCENSFLTIGGRKAVSQAVKIGGETLQSVVPSVIWIELRLRVPQEMVLN